MVKQPFSVKLVEFSIPKFTNMMVVEMVVNYVKTNAIFTKGKVFVNGRYITQYRANYYVEKQAILCARIVERRTN